VTTPFSITLVGWRGTSGRFSKATADAIQQMQDAVQAQGAALVQAAEAHSPHGQHPFGVPHDYVRFAGAWRAPYEPTDTGGTVTLENVSPHADYVLFPTRPHPIDAEDRDSVTFPGHAHVLRFMGKGGKVVFREHVEHPGTHGNPVHERAWAQVEVGVSASLARVAGRVDAAFAAAWAPAQSEG